MKLRELKEWINSKDESEMDTEIAVATHMYPSKYSILHPTVIGWYSSADDYSGYLLMSVTHRELELLEKIEDLKKELVK